MDQYTATQNAERTPATANRTRRNEQTAREDVLAAHAWLAEVYEPVVSAVPDDLRAKLEDAEVFHEVLEHRWYLSEAAGRDVGLDDAVADYVRHVLQEKPDEATILPMSGDDTGMLELDALGLAEDQT
jgi:hypothetical protein